MRLVRLISSSSTPRHRTGSGEQVGDAEARSPMIEIAHVELPALHLQDSDYIGDLPPGRFVALAMPEQLAQDRIFRRREIDLLPRSDLDRDAASKLAL